MGKKQTRRSISVKGTTYTRWKAHCDALGKSMSGRLEEILAQEMEDAGAAELVLPPRAEVIDLTNVRTGISPTYEAMADEVFQ